MNEKSIHILEFQKITAMLADYTATPYGRELAENLMPSSDLSEIKANEQQTSDAVDRIRLHGSLSFSGVREIRPILSRLTIGASLNASELLSLSSLLGAVSRAKSYGDPEGSSEGPDSLCGMFSSLQPFQSLNQEINRCILSEDEIADDASPALSRVRRNMQALRERIHTQLNSMLVSMRDYLQDSVITMRDGRYCLPVKLEYRNQVSGMIHDQSASGSTIFIEPSAIVRLNNELRDAELTEEREIEAVLASLSSSCAEHIDALKEDYTLLGTLDFIFAKALLSGSYEGSEPALNEEGIFEIKKGRHPLLDPHTVVPIDLTVKPPIRQLIITGPNTGGKTVTLKTIGLFCLMAQAGLHIPALDGSSLPVFREIYADIGDEQSIEQSLSTFSAHMSHIVSFLNDISDDCLVLFDELGAGTDPTEGAALATSILSYLSDCQVMTFATTHYSELKEYALTTGGVENASCEFDVETLAPTYRLLIGIPGKSNAFAISKKLGLPDFLIDDAKARMDATDIRFEDLVAGLEKDRKELEADRDAAKADREEAEALKKRYESKLSDLNARKEKELQEAKETARASIKEAKDYADEMIRRINKQGQASGSNVIKSLEKERTELREKLNDANDSSSSKKAVPKKAAKASGLHIGDGVHVISLNLDGTVNSLPNAKGNLTVSMGILHSEVNISDIELLDEPSVTSDVPSKTGASSIGMSKAATISPEINLIGKTVDEALSLLDKYLDDAYLSHLKTVRIIHGRGTGTLRRAISGYLKKLPYVKSYRSGEFGEGDSGVTIVEFKS